jgi:hypothetical protein
MKKIFFLSLIISTFFIQNAYSFATFNFPAKNPNMDGCKSKPCSCSCYDPYEPRVFAKVGIDQDNCLDTCTMRNLLVLDDFERNKFSPEKDEMVIANIRHNGTFYVGKINPNNIKDIIYQVDWFGIWPQGHGQLCFVFEEPLTLIPQLTNVDRTKIEKVKKLVFSIHGTTVPNKEMNFQTAMNSEITTIFMMGSLIDDIKYSVAQEKHTIEQHLLKLTIQEKVSIFKNLMNHSNTIGYTRLFNLTDNNCVSELFKVLDNSLNDFNSKINEIMKSDFTRLLPTETANYFKKLGIYNTRLEDINPKNYVKLINFENLNKN